jgi:hypothetical protein
MRPGTPSLAAAAIAVGALATASALELKRATLATFDRYVALTESRIAKEVDGSAPFLWVDRHPERDRAALDARLKRGEVISERLTTLDGTKEINVDDGMIHHWVGTILLPGIPLDRVVAFVQQYDRYPEWFGPTIQRARLIRHSGDHFDVAMRTTMNKIITVVVDGDYAIDYRRLSSTRLYTRSVARNLYDVKSPGAANEQRTPVDQINGFLWRLNTYCSFDERPEGTYEQCESISLTRGIPFGFGLIVKPFVTGIPRETLEFTLGRVRDGLRK